MRALRFILGIPNVLLSALLVLSSLMAVLVSIPAVYADSVIATIAVGSYPGDVAVNETTNKIYVANGSSSSLTVINGADNSTSSIALGARPGYLVINETTNKIYVLMTWYSGNGSVKVINGATNSVEATVTVGSDPRAIAVNSTSNKIYVTNFNAGGAGSLTRINGADNTTTSISTGNGPMGIGVNETTNVVYVSHYSAYIITVINGVTDSVTASIATALWGIDDIAVNPTTNKIYVCNFNGNKLIAINGADNSTTNITVGGSYPACPAVNQTTNRIYVAIQNPPYTVSVVDGATGSLLTSVSIGFYSGDVAVNSVTNKIYVPSTSGNVYVINGADNTTSTVAVGTDPYNLAVNPNTNRVYVTNSGSNTCSVIQGGATTPSITVTLPTAGATWAVGEAAPITWTSTALTNTLTIQLARNGVNFTETITTGVTNTATQYTWTITGLASSNCLVRVTDGTVTGTSGTFTITHSAVPNSVFLTPATATIQATTSTAYILTAHDTYTNTWDVTSSATYSIDPGAGGTWTSTNVYNSSKAGIWTVTASFGGKSATATLEVTHSNTVDHVVLTPATATIVAGTSTAYTLTAHDTYTNTWDVTASATYSIDPAAEGTWTSTNVYNSSKAGIWTVTASYGGKSATATLDVTPVTIAVTSPTAGAHWPIGTARDITWTSTDLNSSTLTILLARNGVNFTETITYGLTSTVTQHPWTVTGPGTINAKIRVLQEATEGTSPGFFTIADAYPYNGTPTTTLDPVLEISGGSGPGTLWVTPLIPANTSNPDLNQFLQQTGQRAALFFDIGQQGLSGILTIVLHYTPQLGEETFSLYLWNGSGWVNVPGILNPASHTFTFTIDASRLSGTPFALGGNPTAMPGISPWALTLLSLSLLSLGGWWFLRRRRLA